MEADLTVPEPGQTRIRAKDYQLDTLAQMAVMGVPADQMASEVDLPIDYVNRLLEGGRNEKFDRLQADYREKVTTKTVNARFALYDFLDDATQAIGEAIRGGDIRLRAEQSWKLLGELAPNPRATVGGGGDHLSIVFNNPSVQAQIGEGITNMTNMFTELRQAVTEQNGNGHTLLGEQALPVPPSQLEVTDGEALPNPGDSVDDFPMEAVEETDERGP